MNYSRQNAAGAGLIAFIGGMVAWAILGPKIKEKFGRNSNWQQIKNDVEDQALKIKDLTRDQYNNIVDEVTTKYSKIQRISRNELMDLVDDLKMHWDKIKIAWDQDNGRGFTDSEKL